MRSPKDKSGRPPGKRRTVPRGPRSGRASKPPERRLGKAKPLEPEHIPEATVHRLSIYGRVLHLMDGEGLSIVSSATLASRCGFNPAQIRKDLAYFGGFGIRGLGYRVRELRDALRRILGVVRVWRVALVGAGNLGAALLAYQGFVQLGFEIAAVLDKDPARTRLGRMKKTEVLAMEALPEIVRQRDIRIGIIAVPAESAQEVADRLVKAKVSAILNFAPIRLSVPAAVRLRNVDLGLELEGLAYYLTQDKRNARKPLLRGA
ncbi:MAG: redox-sensing transcriptional repressor Rex [Nitrospinota bacterium]|nr:redox-sensing transcriptional repressor Rex [Nitrospinota bacterium]HJM43853.1 redox-sensing transcriptional repressor Rex [Nitrospinota bacterium]